MAGRTRVKSLKTLLTRERLLDIAGDRYFERGENYADRGYVHDLVLDGEFLTAGVTGTEEYEVELWAEDGELEASCTCPLGVEDIFCKHCVAVGLVWLASPKLAKAPTKRSRGGAKSDSKPVTIQEVEAFLAEQDKATLLQWILERVKQDEDWRQQFFLKVAAQRPQGLDITTFRRALKDAIAVYGFLEWDEVYDYTDGISSVLTSIEDLLEAHPLAVLELCEYGLSLLETAMNSVNDSSGEMGCLQNAFEKLHYQACELGSPDPVVLATQLFHGEMNSGFGVFEKAVETYAPFLGKTGLSYYRNLAESMWEALPSPTPKTETRTRLRGAKTQETGRWDAAEQNYKRQRLQRILENLAHLRGDLEAVVALKSQDLSRPYTYLEIAELYRQNKQRDRALEWAESGLAAFAHSDDLRDLVINEYFRRKRTDEAMELTWQGFVQSRLTLNQYQKLKTNAEKAKQWPVWREKALAHIRETLAPTRSSPDSATAIAGRGGGQTAFKGSSPQKRRSIANAPVWNRAGGMERDRSQLVEIFLWEGDPELAWQEAQAGDCSRALWLKLAEGRQETDPEDALPIFLREIESLIQETHNAAYAEAIAYLKKVHKLMVHLKRKAEFNSLVGRLGNTYKGKRNFIKLLQQQKW
jgi:uncharacterized Zn finger protein